MPTITEGSIKFIMDELTASGLNVTINYVRRAESFHVMLYEDKQSMHPSVESFNPTLLGALLTAYELLYQGRHA